jgi:hypothetical protein
MKLFHLPRYLLPLLGLMLACGPVPVTEEVPEVPETPLSVVALSYLSSPALSELQAQLLDPEVRFVAANRRKGEVYFSLPASYDSLRLRRLCARPDLIVKGKPVGGEIRLGKVKEADLSRQLIRFPYQHFRVDSSRVLRRQWGTYTYELTLPQLRDLHKARTLYNSPAIFAYELFDGTRTIANHVAPIALPGEPSLTAFVQQLLPDSLPPEAQAQRLLDFVTEEIDYEFHGRREIFMKPHETLLHGQSDCSGKVVLFASLLEQIDYPYLLVYLDNHICVGLPGDFSPQNGLYFDHDSVRYAIAETTVAGFEIGQTRLVEPITEAEIRFLQAPGHQSKLYHFTRGDSIGFLTVQMATEG